MPTATPQTAAELQADIARMQAEHEANMRHVVFHRLRRPALLAATPLGRQVLEEEGGVGSAAHTAAQRRAVMERHRALLNLTPLGRRALAEEG